ncbi:MAG: YeeE/YedE family protein [Gammaproteobacteria bacterium]
MTQFTPVASIVGGTFIGLAAVMLFRLNGRIAGISGIFHGLIGADHDQRVWRLLFLAGLVAGGLIYQTASGHPLAGFQEHSLVRVGLGGLLVGIGTRLGSGCTSGHGVCGIARLSMRSIAATIVFLVVGILTASVLYEVLS